MASTNGGSRGTYQEMEQILAKLLAMPEFSDLAALGDIKYHVLALWYFESGYNNMATSPDNMFTKQYTLIPRPSKDCVRIWGKASFRIIGGDPERGNPDADSSIALVKGWRNKYGDKKVVDFGLFKANGLGQVMGWHLIPELGGMAKSRDPNIQSIIKKFKLNPLEGNADLSIPIIQKIHGSAAGGYSAKERSAAASLLVMKVYLLDKKKLAKYKSLLDGVIRKYVGEGELGDLNGTTAGSYTATIASLVEVSKKTGFNTFTDADRKVAKKASGGAGPSPSSNATQVASAQGSTPGCES